MRIRVRGDDELELGVEVGHHTRADALALVVEGALDGLCGGGIGVGQPLAERFLEAVVLGLQLGSVTQTRGLLYEQAAQHALTGLQVGRQRDLGIARHRAARDDQAHQLHQQQQAQEEGHDAALQAAEVEEGGHQSRINPGA